MPVIEECTVKRIKGNNTFIELTRTAKCEGCKACSFNKRNSIVMPAINEIDCKVGDRVEVVMPEKTVNLAPVYLYVIPLILMLIGILLGLLFNEVVQIVLAITFVIIGIFIAFCIDKIIRRQSKFLPTIKSVIDGQSEKENIETNKSSVILNKDIDNENVNENSISGT